MARDYNRRSTARKNQAPQQLLVMVMSFLLGYLTATVMDIKSLAEWVNTQVLDSKGHQQEEPKHIARQKPQQPKPKFEFYTLLADEKNPGAAKQATAKPAATQVAKTADKPSTTVQASNTAAAQVSKIAPNKVLKPADVKVAEGKPLPPTQVKSPARRYVIQVAAFKARSDAEQMKGMLILKGYSVNVVPVNNARGIWFRVIVGPYADKSLAQNAQATLVKNERLRGMVNPV